MVQDQKRQQARVFIGYLRVHTKDFPQTLSDVMVDRFGLNPFIILSACLISLRARDRVTTPICLKLFEKARTPAAILAVPLFDLEQMLFSVGFYKVKASVLHEVAQVLIERHGGLVPQDLKALKALPGVGLKTANLVLGLAFGVPAICVDVHVHRISNDLGWVQTTTPEQTEAALRQLLPQDLWIEWNRQLVLVGQNGCLSRKGCGYVCRVRELGLVKDF